MEPLLYVPGTLPEMAERGQDNTHIVFLVQEGHLTLL